jgi:hypothetical protein
MTSREEEELVDFEPEKPMVFSAAEDDMFSSDDTAPAYPDGPASILLPPLNDLPVNLTEDCNVPGRKRSQFSPEGMASSASESGSPESGSPVRAEAILPLLYSPTNDAIGEPAAAGRKQRRASEEKKSSTSAVEAGQDASETAPKRRIKTLRPPAAAGGEGGSTGRPPPMEGNNSDGGKTK